MRSRYTISIIVAIIYAMVELYAFYPRQVTFLCISFAVGYLVFFIAKRISLNNISRESRKERRLLALQRAEKYLKEYHRPFGDLCLQNNNIIVRFTDNKQITARGKGRDVVLTGTTSDNTDVGSVFDDICMIFNSNTNINNIHSIFMTSGLDVNYKGMENYEYYGEKQTVTDIKTFDIAEEGGTIKSVKTFNKVSYKKKDKNNKDTNNVDIIPNKENEEIKKIDINTASEAEIQSLPGINIVIAKKILKMRKEKGGFESVDDFINTLEIKPHFAQKIRKLVVVGKIDKNKKNKQTQGRILDI